MLPTSLDNIRYMEETTFTQGAAETAESTATTASDLIPEAALALTERSNPVEWIPVFLPVTMQQMEDVEGIEAYVESRLMYDIRNRLDLQVLVGNGTTPNLKGTENVTGIQTQALGADSIPDAIYKAMTKIRDDGFAEPSVVFIRAAKWQNVRLLKTADGLYIWGHPSQAGPENIWGVPVVQSNAVTSTKAIVGDYATYSTFWTKRGITIAVSDSHAHYFTRGMLAVRADMRGAMVHYRPKAFAEVTGL
jgi:HK97 family phage major capsid protein